MVQGNRFDLQQVWELLEEQPGFTAEAAKPPICLFHSWREKLGLDIRLPEDLRGLSDKELALEAAKCPVGPNELARVLRLGVKKPARSAPAAVELPPAAASARRSRPLVLATAGVVAAACFLFAGHRLRQGCAGPAWQTISTRDFTELPVASARRIGSEVGVRLPDEQWLEVAEDARRRQLETTLRQLESRDVTALFVEAPDGRVVATAQFFGEPQKIRVRFR
jgi:hypothetical protein